MTFTLFLWIVLLFFIKMVFGVIGIVWLVYIFRDMLRRKGD